MKKTILGILILLTFLTLHNLVYANSAKAKAVKPTFAGIKAMQLKNEKAIGYNANYSTSISQLDNLIKKLSPYCPKSSQDQSFLTALVEQRQRTTINLFLNSAKNSKTLVGYCNGKMTAYRLGIAMIKFKKLENYQNSTKQDPLEIYNNLIKIHSQSPLAIQDIKSKIQFSLFNGGYNRTEKQKSLLEPSKELFVSIYNDMLIKLVKSNVLNEGELSGILTKTRVEFTNRCDFIHGLTEIEITTRYPENVSTTGLSFIQYNVNVCDDPSYMSELDLYLQSLIVHELGHYHYYIKNNSVEEFNKICRIITPSSMVNKCSRNEFVSDYAMGNNEEDYAESFQFWYLNKYPINGNSKLIEKKAHFEPFKK